MRIIFAIRYLMRNVPPRYSFLVHNPRQHIKVVTTLDQHLRSSNQGLRFMYNLGNRFHQHWIPIFTFRNVGTMLGPRFVAISILIEKIIQKPVTYSVHLGHLHVSNNKNTKRSNILKWACTLRQAWSKVHLWRTGGVNLGPT